MKKIAYILILVFGIIATSCNFNNCSKQGKDGTIVLPINYKRKPSVSKIKKDIVGFQVIDRLGNDVLEFTILEEYIKEIKINKSDVEGDSIVYYNIKTVFQRDKGGSLNANINVVYNYDEEVEEYKINNFTCNDLSYVKTGKYDKDVKLVIVDPLILPNYLSITNNNYRSLIVSGKYSSFGEWIEFNIEVPDNTEKKLGIFVDDYEIYFIERPF